MAERTHHAEEDGQQPDTEELLRRQAEASVLDPAGPSALVTDASVAEGGRVTEGEDEQRELIEGQEATE